MGLGSQEEKEEAGTVEESKDLLESPVRRGRREGRRTEISGPGTSQRPYSWCMGTRSFSAVYSSNNDFQKFVI